jgi:hypothetical protein
MFHIVYCCYTLRLVYRYQKCYVLFSLLNDTTTLQKAGGSKKLSFATRINSYNLDVYCFVGNVMTTSDTLMSN